MICECACHQMPCSPLRELCTARWCSEASVSSSRTLAEVAQTDDGIDLSLMLTVQMQQMCRPTLHVDSFLYDEDQVDSLCETGTMSRSFCLTCGSYRTAPLGKNTSTAKLSSSTFSHPDDSCLLLLQISSLTHSPSQNYSLFSRRFFQTWMEGSWWMLAQDWELFCMGSVGLKQRSWNCSTKVFSFYCLKTQISW